MRYWIGMLFLVLNLEAVELRIDGRVIKLPKNTTAKKLAYYKKVVPAVDKVYKQFYHAYKVVQEDIKTHQHTVAIEQLKKLYKVKSDRALLMALKPHPRSITIAQGAIESAWGTSRFFKEANNIFGMWSSNAHQPRIAAGKKRGKRTIWLRKFDRIEDSVRAYYVMLARGKSYKRFRQLRFETDNVFKIIKGLNHYSERGQAYVHDIGSVIRHNKLTQFDK